MRVGPLLGLALLVGGGLPPAVDAAATDGGGPQSEAAICRVPPEGLEKASRVPVPPSADHRTAREAADDWLPNQAGACFASRGSSGDSEAFELLICLDRPGRSLGTQVETSRTGRIRSRPMGCDLAQMP